MDRTDIVPPERAGSIRGQLAVAESPAAGLDCGLGSFVPVGAASLPGPTAVRPSTIRRHRRMQALIAEFGKHDMDYILVAAFLQCSLTAARTYLNELAEASVIFSRRSMLAGDCSLRGGYRLNDDPWVIGRFLADLSASCGSQRDLTRGGKPISPSRFSGTRHLHIIADDRYVGVKPTQVAVRRDPLVAALFGTESLRKVALA